MYIAEYRYFNFPCVSVVFLDSVCNRTVHQNPTDDHDEVQKINRIVSKKLPLLVVINFSHVSRLLSSTTKP
jgi:hypothetical protein